MASWCALVFFPSIMDNYREWLYYSMNMPFYIILCDISFNYVYLLNETLHLTSLDKTWLG